MILSKRYTETTTMDPHSKVKVGLTTTAAILGCAGLSYIFIRYWYRVRNAADALTHLTIETVETEEKCNSIVSELRRRSAKHKALGFDCEWVTDGGRRRPVALMQLSSFDGLCGLFRLSHLKTIPESLKDLLEDETIYKVGVAPLDDSRYLLTDYDINLHSTLDLRFIAQVSGYNAGGLANLSKSILGIVLDKSWRVRCSDWEAEELTERQKKYAAADAHVAIKLFVRLLDQLEGKHWLPSWWSGPNGWTDAAKLCATFADRHYKAKQGVSGSKKDGKPTQSKDKDKRYPHATRSKPLYHNCFLEAPDGELLCTCDNRKAQWYVDKQLADTVSTDPFTVRLRFEPAGRSVGPAGQYYTLIKENKCVVCAADHSYIRKNVVPREYRKYFPEVMKDHSSHDVVLLCTACHQRSNMADRRVRVRLAAQCGAPLGCEGDNQRYTEDADLKKIRSAARALLYQSRKHVLPETRRKELEAIVLSYNPQHEEVTPELLEEAARAQVIFENADYESHGSKVVEHYQANEGILRLEELWRDHFLDSMQPRHMPPLWSVTHNAERMRIRLNEGRLSQEDAKLLGLSKWINT